MGTGKAKTGKAGAAGGESSGLMPGIKVEFKFVLRPVNKLDSVFEKGDNSNRHPPGKTVFRRVKVREGKSIGVGMDASFRLIASRTKGSQSILRGRPDFSSGAFV
jgi:hypothetical protein